ncbi:amidase domain-containing protein [Virgibacillus byunsanensis]|uniref:Amidase domain-containing protein n=1 Tax=Virgibacillus byunsanensis TaxID=570945 RepID=A0ABW3LJX8_9BACI
MEKLANIWLDFLQSEPKNDTWWDRKKKLCDVRQAEMVRINGKGRIFHTLQYDREINYHYLLHLSMLVKQNDYMYLEEQVIPYQFRVINGEVIDHQEMEKPIVLSGNTVMPEITRDLSKQRFSYNRLAAVKYAERWWNSYNPAYEKFDVDCTNYVSQCLSAGGAPTYGAPNRGSGWWYSGGNWSYSWAVAHSLRWYLSGSTKGLKGKEVQSANELLPGDIICYDFQGDGKFDHNTIVVAKDTNGMPLVNAHTDNSRNRYWSYEDSTAYTPNIKYKFFRIGE